MIDLVVIGGGIHGLFAAYDAALRGWSVTLVEQADFGGALSSNHQRTIHGGLRSLGRGQFAKVRQQILERRSWARMAPALVRPLPFVAGTYRWSSHSRTLLSLGLTAYNALARGQNDLVSPALHLPASRTLSRAEVQQLYRGIETRRLSGGIVWHDYQTVHPDRLNWTVALAARSAGATLKNYTEVIGPLRNGSQIVGVRVRDHRTGQDYDIEARATLMAAGAGLPRLSELFGIRDAVPLIGAMNLLFDRPAGAMALAGRGASGRMLTAVPWHDHWLVGTAQSDAPVTSVTAQLRTDMTRGLLADANRAFPFLEAAPADIRMVHFGMVPATVKHGRADLLADPLVRSHEADGAAGLYSLVGVKFTTARLAAEAAVNAIALDRGDSSQTKPSTADRALPFATRDGAEDDLGRTSRDLGLTLDEDVATHLVDWYGTEAATVLAYAAGAGLATRLAPTTPVLAGEIAFAAECADAFRLDDAVLRRTALGSAGHPGDDAVAAAATVMAKSRGWNESERANEIARCSSFWPSASGRR